MEQILNFLYDSVSGLLITLQYVESAAQAVAVYVPLFFGQQIGTALMAALAVAVVLKISGR